MKRRWVEMVVLTALAGVSAWADPAPSKPAAPAQPTEAAVGYDSKGRRDPFIPLVRDGRLVGSASDASSPLSTSKPQLLGILWDPGGHSIALINNTEVMAGERVGPYRVAEIRQDAVVLQDGKTTLVLQITFDSSGGGEGP